MFFFRNKLRRSKCLPAAGSNPGVLTFGLSLSLLPRGEESCDEALEQVVDDAKEAEPVQKGSGQKGFATR